MKKELWQRFVTNNFFFKPDHPQYRRVYLLNTALIALFFICLFYVVMNLLVNNVATTIVNAAASAGALGILVCFHRSNRVLLATYLSVALLLLTMTAYIAFNLHHHFALFWITVIPPVVFFLLGKRKGQIVTGLYFLGILIFLLTGYRRWEPFEFNIAGIINIAMATLTLVYMINYFEISRIEAAAALMEKNAELEKLSVTDALTGLYNRTRLDAVLRAETSRAARSGNLFSVLMADLDRFKRINDEYGHMMGDAVLVEVGIILADGCRVTDVAGRWGGEEFLVLCPDTDEAGAATLAEKLNKKTAAHDFPEGIRMTISIGVTGYRSGDTEDAIIRRADSALYAAKSKGRNRVETA